MSALGQKQTSVVTELMSAKGQKRPSAVSASFGQVALDFVLRSRVNWSMAPCTMQPFRWLAIPPSRS